MQVGRRGLVGSEEEGFLLGDAVAGDLEVAVVDVGSDEAIGPGVIARKLLFQPRRSVTAYRPRLLL